MVGRQDWETPWELFARLDKHFHFTIDAAATAANTKCARYITPEQGGLGTEVTGETIWCNPPYQHVLPWAKQFIRWQEHNTVVCLLQDKTDTAWFAELWAASCSVTFLTGRVNFVGTATSNMHGAVLFHLFKKPAHYGGPVVRIWDWRINPW